MTLEAQVKKVKLELIAAVGWTSGENTWMNANSKEYTSFLRTATPVIKKMLHAGFPLGVAIREPMDAAVISLDAQFPSGMSQPIYEFNYRLQSYGFPYQAWNVYNLVCQLIRGERPNSQQQEMMRDVLANLDHEGNYRKTGREVKSLVHKDDLLLIRSHYARSLTKAKHL